MHPLLIGAAVLALLKGRGNDQGATQGPAVAPPPPKGPDEVPPKDWHRIHLRSLHLAQQRINWGEPPEAAARAGADQAVEEYVQSQNGTQGW